jgi:hypothetical protein
MKLLNSILLLLAAALLSVSFADLTAANDVVQGGEDMDVKEVTRRLMMVSVDRLAIWEQQESTQRCHLTLQTFSRGSCFQSHLKQVICLYHTG